MIKYALHCDQGHGFESWFPDSSAFDQQRRRGLVDCPHCGSRAVEKQIMAPAVRSAREALEEPGRYVLPDERAGRLRAMLRELHAHVVANTEDVGGRFAEEARRIHAGEGEDRAIRGQASLAEAIELREEGIGVLPLPVPPDDMN